MVAELGNEPRCSENGFWSCKCSSVCTECGHLRALWSQELSDNNISVVTCLTGSKERRWSGSGRELLAYLHQECMYNVCILCQVF